MREVTLDVGQPPGLSPLRVGLAELTDHNNLIFSWAKNGAAPRLIYDENLEAVGARSRE